MLLQHLDDRQMKQDLNPEREPQNGETEALLNLSEAVILVPHQNK